MDRLGKERETILLYGEGLQDQNLLLHLVNCYNTRNSGRHIRVKNGKGGSPADIVQGAINYGHYKLRVVKMDHDKLKKEIEKAELLAGKRKIRLIWSKPCLETTLLHVLEPTADYSSRSSTFCKKRFEKIYASSNQRKDPTYLHRIMPKEKIEEARLRVVEIDELIKIIEGNI